jgi:hypothetical protein
MAVHHVTPRRDGIEGKRGMTNDEARMTKEARMSNAERMRPGNQIRHLGFVIFSSFVLRHSCFVIRHLRMRVSIGWQRGVCYKIRQPERIEL